VLTQVAVEGLPADVLDQLPERGGPMVAVPESGARLGLQAQAPAVVLGQGGDATSELHGLAEVPPQQP
jgi:hypothetical protein